MSFLETEDDGRECDQHSETEEDFREVFEEPCPRRSDDDANCCEETDCLAVTRLCGRRDGRRLRLGQFRRCWRLHGLAEYVERNLGPANAARITLVVFRGPFKGKLERDNLFV